MALRVCSWFLRNALIRFSFLFLSLTPLSYRKQLLQTNSSVSLRFLVVPRCAGVQVSAGSSLCCFVVFRSSVFFFGLVWFGFCFVLFCFPFRFISLSSLAFFYPYNVVSHLFFAFALLPLRSFRLILTDYYWKSSCFFVCENIPLHIVVRLKHRDGALFDLF